MHSFRLQNRSWLSLQFMLNHSFVLTDYNSYLDLYNYVYSERFSHSLDTLCPCCTLICAIATMVRGDFLRLAIGVRHLPPPLSLILGASLHAIIQNSA